MAKARKPPAKPKTTAKARPKKPRPVGDDETFWKIIERVEKKSRGDLEAACAAFTKELQALDDDTLVRVEISFCDAMKRSYDWDVWAAAYVIHGGCSDDSFWDFRAGLVALGKDVFEAALEDPESLASVRDVVDRTIFEGFQYVPEEVLEERGLKSKGVSYNAGSPSGKQFDEDDLPARFPRLHKKFG
jgi:hypothetical protein